MPALNLTAYGSSYTVGGADSTLANSWFNQIVNMGGWATTSNRGLSGGTSHENALDALTNRNSKKWVSPGTGVVIIDSIINNVQLWGSDPYGYEAARNSIRTLVELARSASKIETSDAAFTFNSGFSATTNPKLSESNGHLATAAGANFDFTWSGDTATLVFLGKDLAGGGSAAGTVTISQGGTTILSKALEGAYKSYPPSGTGSAADYGSPLYQGPVPVRLSGFGSGSHTVRVTVSTAGGVVIDCAMQPQPSPPGVVLVKDAPREEGRAGFGWSSSTATGASNATLANYAAILDSIASEYPAGQVVTCNPGVGWNLNTMMVTTDGKHPNDLGMTQYAQTIRAAILALSTAAWTPTPTGGTPVPIGLGFTYSGIFTDAFPLLRPPAALSDSFNRADNAASLGSTDGGTASSVAWVQNTTTGGVIGVQSAKARAKAGTGTVIATIETGTANGRVKCTMVGAKKTGTRGASLAFRYTDMNNYWFISSSQTPAVGWALVKKVSGNNTVVADLNTVVSDGDVPEVLYNGNTIVVFINDIPIGTYTDSALATATQVGLVGNFAVDTQSNWDDFAYYTS